MGELCLFKLMIEIYCILLQEMEYSAFMTSQRSHNLHLVRLKEKTASSDGLLSQIIEAEKKIYHRSH